MSKAVRIRGDSRIAGARNVLNGVEERNGEGIFNLYLLMNSISSSEISPKEVSKSPVFTTWVMFIDTSSELTLTIVEMELSVNIYCMLVWYTYGCLVHSPLQTISDILFIFVLLLW